jgi:hypothetical protein
MLTDRSLASKICITLACGLGLGAPANALVTLWEASSGLLPDQVDPAWNLNDNAPATDPVLSAGVLTLSTAAQAQNMFYNMTGSDLDFSATSGYWLEGTMRFVSGSNLAGWNRTPAVMGMVFAGGNRATLQIRQDSIFILNGDNTVGAINNSVDTDDAFHTYRMEIAGKTAGSIVNVYQDGLLVLTDNSVYNNGASTGSVAFGESSVLATGISEWTYFSHNAAAVAAPEPATVTTLLAGCVALAARRRRSRA